MTTPLSNRSLLDEDILSNDIHYFFSLHHRPKFRSMEDSMAESLGKRFGHEFRVIRIVRGWPSKSYDTPNYILVNQEALNEEAQTGVAVLDMPEVQDTNVEFAADHEILELATELRKKQGTVYVVPFQSDQLDLLPEVFTLLGPDPKIVEDVDSKARQLGLFSELGLPHINYRIFDSAESLRTGVQEVLPVYLSAPHSSGGRESGFIRSDQDIDEFFSRLRPINQDGPFTALDVFEDIILAPNINVAVNKNGDIRLLVVSDQIMRGNSYGGNIYPSHANGEQRRVMFECAQKIGRHLALTGYRGLFGCDFLINKSGEIVVVDLNPRHQGGYAINGLSLSMIGLSLADIELEALFDDSFSVSQEQLDVELPFAWTHSSITAPLGTTRVPDLSVSDHLDTSKPFHSIGTSWSGQFYRSGMRYVRGELGHFIATAPSREAIEGREWEEA